MIIIAFAPKSSKVLPNIFCKNFKHCAVLVPRGHNFTMYQFSSHKNVAKIDIRLRDLRLLCAHGWCFVYVPGDVRTTFNPHRAWTCVDMSKRAIGMHAPFIWSPDALYKKLCE